MNDKKLNRKQQTALKEKSAKRAYNNESRRESSEQNKRLIIETLVALLVEKKGGDVTFKEIADRSGLAERSIYRFYNDKEELHLAMDGFLNSYIESSVEQLRTMDVATFAKNAFLLFDRYEALVQAYIYSPFGQEARKLFRHKLNQLIALKLSQEKPSSQSLDRHKKIAVICSLINAKIWNDIRIDFGYSGEDIGDTIEWAISALIEKI